MNLEDAIKHCEEVADKHSKSAAYMKKLYGEHIAGYKFHKENEDTYGQLAEWLRDYKRLLEQQPCDDCISRQAVLDQTYLWSKDEFLRVTNPFDYLRKKINSLSPVTPQSKTGHCKDCKWWKDSDGLYRRGGNAESQCPINRREVFEGNGYCYMFKSRESEEI